MSENGWGKSDKKAAYAALDKAWAAEFAETKLKIIKQVADMRYTDDIEQLERELLCATSANIGTRFTTILSLLWIPNWHAITASAI